MYRKVLAVTMMMAILLAGVPLAQAITFGQPDGNNHPNVGAMIVLEPDGNYYLYCSGTLIAPKVFLTAAHCTAAAKASGAAPHDVFVTFDPIWDPETSTLHRGTYDINPNYGHDSHDPNDIAVIILDEALTIEPASLPPAGLLSDMENSHELKGKQFVAVGYGRLRDDKARGPHSLGDYGERYYAEQTFSALKPYWLQLSMNPSTGDGGTCYGDSGGPHFLGNMVVSLTVTGDAWCRATDVTYRLDTDSAIAYLRAAVGLNPSPRGYVSMAYDAESDRVILFGGQTGNIFTDPANYNGETWAYDVAANQWTQMKPPSGPTARAVSALAYDAGSDRVILFGGGDKDVWDLDDTWAYDFESDTWTQMKNGPARHLGARLAYDAQSSRIILFGGYDLSNFYYNDTWAYDSASDTWTEMKPSTSPPGRNYQAMAYDAAADKVLVWGGTDLKVKLLPPSVWAYDYDTNTWEERPIPEGPHPEGADYAAMVYDDTADRTILYGGVYQGDETWAYDYSTNSWTELEPSTVPGELSRHAMAYNSIEDRVILFGGQVGSKYFNYTGETWSYDLNSNTWTNVTPNP